MKYSRHYALKYCFIFLTSFFLSQNSVASTGAAEVDPHVLIKEMVTIIVGSTNAKSAQETLCKEGGVFRRSVKVKGKILPVVAHNCGSYDFFNYAMLMCSDYPGFSGSTCFKKGTEVFKKRGETPDLEKAKQYIENAIRDKKVDPHTLACSTPAEKLMGAFKEVAARGCAPETKPVAKPQTGWQVTKPSAAAGAGAKITIGSHKLNPPVNIVRSSLRDLPSNQGLEIDRLDLNQSALQSALQGMSLQSAGKSAAVKGSMLQQEQSLVTQYESVNSTLSSLKIEIDGGKKSLRTDLIAAAQKLNADTKKLLETLNVEAKIPTANVDTRKFLDALKSQPKAAAAA